MAVDFQFARPDFPGVSLWWYLAAVIVLALSLPLNFTRHARWWDEVGLDALSVFQQVFKVSAFLFLFLQSYSLVAYRCELPPSLWDHFDKTPVVPRVDFVCGNNLSAYSSLNLTEVQFEDMAALCDVGLQWGFYAFLVVLEGLTLFYLFIFQRRLLMGRFHPVLGTLANLALAIAWGLYEVTSVGEFTTGSGNDRRGPFRCELSGVAVTFRALAVGYIVQAVLILGPLLMRTCTDQVPRPGTAAYEAEEARRAAKAEASRNLQRERTLHSVAAALGIDDGNGSDDVASPEGVGGTAMATKKRAPAGVRRRRHRPSGATRRASSTAHRSVSASASSSSSSLHEERKRGRNGKAGGRAARRPKKQVQSSTSSAEEVSASSDETSG